MTVSTHVSTAIALSTLSMLGLHTSGIYTMDPNFIATFILAVAIGSVFPDIDEPESWIGRRTIFISNFIKFIFGHRGMTHTILSSILIFISVFMLSKYLKINETGIYLSVGFAVGWLLHSIGDAHTKGGVPLFLPFSKKKFYVLPKILRFKTNSWVEYFYSFLYNMITALVFVYAIKLNYIEV